MNGEDEPARFGGVLNHPRRAIDLAVIHIGVEHIGIDVAFHVADFRFHLVASTPVGELLVSDFVVKLREVIWVGPPAVSIADGQEAAGSKQLLQGSEENVSLSLQGRFHGYRRSCGSRHERSR